MEVKTNRGRCNFPWGKCLPSYHHPSPCTDECFQGCWLEHTMLSVLIIRFLTALLIVDHIPCLQPHYLLCCLDSWFASLADFSSICSTLLDGMHRLMNGGGRPLAPAAVFEYEWKQWKSSEAAGYNWYAIIHRWHQIHPPGTKEGKKLLPYKKIINVLIIKIQTKLSALSVFTTW